MVIFGTCALGLKATFRLQSFGVRVLGLRV